MDECYWMNGGLISKKGRFVLLISMSGCFCFVCVCNVFGNCKTVMTMLREQLEVYLEMEFEHFLLMSWLR